MLFQLPKFINPQIFGAKSSLGRRKALKLDAFDSSDIKKAAQILKNGGVIAFPFNGIFGLFGDIENKEVIQLINHAKGRPKDKKLVVVSLPERIHEYLDFSSIDLTKKQLNQIWKQLHALGVLAPPSRTAPKHLIELGNDRNLIAIWTEYKPLRNLVMEFRKLGGRALYGTSANKTGNPTHTKKETVWQDFIHDVDAVIEADFDHLPELRKKSTTIVDMTGISPSLFRLGNVEINEVKKVLKKLSMKPLTIPENFKKV